MRCRKISCSERDLILLANVDQDSNFLIGSKNTARRFGYCSPCELEGRNAYDMRCPAVQYAEKFIEQDRLVFNEGESIQFLDIHLYDRNEQCVFLTEKRLMEEWKGVKFPILIHCRYVDLADFHKMIFAEFLNRLKNDFTFLPKKSRLSMSCRLVSKDPFERKLTLKQMEILFCINCGLENNEISKYLNKTIGTVDKTIGIIKSKLGVTRTEDREELKERILSFGYNTVLPETLFHRTFDFSILKEDEIFCLD